MQDDTAIWDNNGGRKCMFLRVIVGTMTDNGV